MYDENVNKIPICGYRPMIRNRRRFELPHDYDTNEYTTVVVGQLEKWVQQRVVKIHKITDKCLQNLTILPMLLEPRKPRLWLVY